MILLVIFLRQKPVEKQGIVAYTGMFLGGLSKV